VHKYVNYLLEIHYSSSVPAPKSRFVFTRLSPFDKTQFSMHNLSDCTFQRNPVEFTTKTKLPSDPSARSSSLLDNQTGRNKYFRVSLFYGDRFRGILGRFRSHRFIFHACVVSWLSPLSQTYFSKDLWANWQSMPSRTYFPGIRGSSSRVYYHKIVSRDVWVNWLAATYETHLTCGEYKLAQKHLFSVYRQ
jgi:hypothetical protein